MLAIKKRYIYPETYLYIALGVAVFGLTIAALFAIDPRFDTDRSVFIGGNQPAKIAQAPASTSDNQQPADNSQPAATQIPSNNTATKPWKSAVATQPVSSNTTNPASGTQPPASSDPSPAAAPDPTPTETPAPNIDPSPAPDPTPAPDTNQSPSLIDNIVGGLMNVVDDIM